jgi:hypothetical protein
MPSRALKMTKNPLDHLGLLDAGDDVHGRDCSCNPIHSPHPCGLDAQERGDLHCTTTPLALFYVDKVN